MKTIYKTERLFVGYEKMNDQYCIRTTDSLGEDDETILLSREEFIKLSESINNELYKTNN